jgi:hypothetical protein
LRRPWYTSGIKYSQEQHLTIKAAQHDLLERAFCLIPHLRTPK